MVFCLIIAILSTFVYINLLISELVNSRVNPAAVAGLGKDVLVTIAKVKYLIILIMSIFWGIVINHYIS